jgi:adenine-specific DNA-methyltransferase
VNRDLTLFDAFCGTGSVSDALKDSFNITSNDSLTWSVIYTRGRLVAHECNFANLNFDPFYFFNETTDVLEGFFYNNYSPGGSNRMYFTASNAGRIDFFRNKIENWKNENLINEDEYCYLLACLIESISDVSNTAGVYGAFLKHWDSRALKPIIFNKVDSNSNEHRILCFYNSKIEEIIEDIDCDILYLDPPYTQNQYGTQYHLLETLVLDDNPSISPITGSRSTAPMRSDWSKDYKAHIVFDKVIAKTKAKYIVLSYSTDGIMSKDYIEAVLKRYGKSETYQCKKITYKKYRNFKTKSSKEHFEYLFFVEKKEEKDVNYESPLNYIGSKSKMIKNIKDFLPETVDKFFDLFGGGFNVGININSNIVIYNDVNFIVKDIVESFKVNDTYKYIQYMKKIENKFGLEISNSESYSMARDYYNSLPFEKRDPKLLYIIILYGFQQQIRFNSNYNFNNPVGMRWFNDKVLEKMISFSRVIKERNFIFKSCNYLELSNEIDNNSFVYMDPPYRLTLGSYNDGKRGFLGWDERSEQELFQFADELNSRNIRFMISYVLEHKGEINFELKRWVERNNYKLIKLDDIKGIKRKEVIIKNYDNS